MPGGLISTGGDGRGAQASPRLARL
jgi:hypothetical protein